MSATEYPISRSSTEDSRRFEVEASPTVVLGYNFVSLSSTRTWALDSSTGRVSTRRYGFQRAGGLLKSAWLALNGHRCLPSRLRALPSLRDFSFKATTRKDPSTRSSARPKEEEPLLLGEWLLALRLFQSSSSVSRDIKTRPWLFRAVTHENWELCNR